MTYYRGFLGNKTKNEVWFQSPPGTWDEAKKFLLDDLKLLETDPCLDCRREGMAAYDSLLECKGTRWHANVDGDDYWIEPDLKAWFARGE